MCHTSPASFLVWGVLSSLLGVFLVFHLWSFDRFKCLKWNNGPSSGAFKRIMTYSYLLSVPLIIIYSVGFAIIKYREGFVAYPFVGVVPKPYTAWAPASSKVIFPLNFVFSSAWSLEMVTHLEELCFWLFLMNAGSRQKNWFHSLYFKAWAVGSVFSVLGMLVVSVLSRKDPLKAEAYTYLAGSLGSLFLTLWFIPVLWAFPSFLDNLRTEGVDMETIVRLTKFSELNTIRVVFRLLFTVPLLILGIDGVRPQHTLNSNMIVTDVLAAIAGFGCAISSGITLVIFFPRSVEGEIAARDAAREKRRARYLRQPSLFGTRTELTQSRNTYPEISQPTGGTYLLTSSPIKQHSSSSFYNIRAEQDNGSMDSKHWGSDGRIVAHLPPIRPNRRNGDDVELGGIAYKLTETNLSHHDLTTSKVHPMVHNFTSPIDFMYTSGQTQQPHDSWLTFHGV